MDKNGITIVAEWDFVGVVIASVVIVVVVLFCFGLVTIYV